ncbi:uncharacterized protein K452DRAFT_306001 [Aplosporella prunicola CBS 121167]|uniref:polynucleotide adenylyltransferase n=1 Tax=Aplosporella prunicola CBS 121167 TaxID=1176127 RepID=A0A6A6BLR0_9PEZI|nr:uncharacterized protein K452DRAFT_306001 [Aplosporella prunicola CBS 121167]KAF2145059.1 hypothetical protein K452DRAFT_306001 [Aplosporella prunicola CBS 121167]
MSSYRPSYSNTRDDARASRRPRRSPPRRSPDVYRFGGDNYRPGSYNDRDADRGGRDSDRRGDFTFRAENEGPRFPPADMRRIGPQNRADQRRPRQQARRGGRPGPWKPLAANARPILRTNREPTPEQLEGMNDGHKRFISLDDVSDSEAEMDLGSEAEEEQAAPEGQPPTKKSRADASDKADGDAAPRWSNPDPYTVLPPPDESQTKKRDVVKMIRKAKVAAEQEAPPKSPVAQNADFISLNFDDEPQDEENDRSSEGSDNEDSSKDVRGTSGTSFSHLDHLHPNRSTLPPKPASSENTVPQDSSTSFNAASLGPPPSLPQLPPLPYSVAGLDVWPPPPPPPPAPMNAKGQKKDLYLEDLDDLKPLPPLPPQGRKRKRGEVIDGGIVESWIPRDRASSTPWCTIDHSGTENMGYWLHKEIADFYDFVRPHAFEDAMRDDLVRRISDALTQKFYNGRLHCFGSFAAGLYLPTADMDLVFISDDFRRSGRSSFANKGMLYKVSSILEKTGISQPGATEVVSGARVPIIKLVDRITGLKVDISFENTSGIVANETFQQWKVQYPAMPILATLIKQFLAMRGLNEVFTGGLGGFSVICMAVSLIHHLPARQSGNMLPEHNLGELLLEFLDLYGNKFNIHNTRICLRPHRYEVKGAVALNGKPERLDRLSIIDPNTPHNDISAGSHNIVLIRRCFSEAYTSLQKRIAVLQNSERSERQSSSILGAIFAGDYSSFDVQRRRLRRIYEDRQR